VGAAAVFVPTGIEHVLSRETVCPGLAYNEQATGPEAFEYGCATAVGQRGNTVKAIRKTRIRRYKSTVQVVSVSARYPVQQGIAFPDEGERFFLELKVTPPPPSELSP